MFFIAPNYFYELYFASHNRPHDYRSTYIRQLNEHFQTCFSPAEMLWNDRYEISHIFHPYISLLVVSLKQKLIQIIPMKIVVLYSYRWKSTTH